MVGGEPMKRNTLRYFEYTDWSSGKKDASQPITDFKSMYLPYAV
jgi:hypothetical protein